MKILFVTDLYPIKRGDNNSPTTLHNFAFEWIKQGHSVDIIKPNFLFNSFLRKKPFYPTGFYEYEGVNVLNVNYFTPFLFDVTKKLTRGAIDDSDLNQANSESLRGTSLRVTRQSNKNIWIASLFGLNLTPRNDRINIESYDIIIGHMPSGIIFAKKLAKKFNKPLICGVHCSDIKVLKNPIYKFYFRTQLEDAYKNSKKIACRSFVLQKKFSEILPELADKTFVAASGVAGCIEVLRDRGIAASEMSLTVLACANLIKRKNIDKLILAMKDLEGFELKIIGDGPELKNLKKLASPAIRPSREKMAESQMRGATFLGKLPHEKVLEEMKKADIFVLPSINETFGMVYLEAMACGCVTICTKNDGIEGIIKDGENGFLCDPTPESISKILLKIKNSSNIKEIITNSLATIKTYTPSNCAGNYLKNIE